MEQIARDAHAFGQNTEQRITELQTQQAAVDHRLLTLPTQIREDIQKCPIEVQLPQGWRAQWDVETRQLIPGLLQDALRTKGGRWGFCTIRP